MAGDAMASCFHHPQHLYEEPFPSAAMIRNMTVGFQIICSHCCVCCSTSMCFLLLNELVFLFPHPSAMYKASSIPYGTSISSVDDEIGHITKPRQFIKKSSPIAAHRANLSYVLELRGPRCVLQFCIHEGFGIRFEIA